METPNELFISVIMTSCSYPRCFGGNTALCRTISFLGFDKYSVSAAFGEFLARDTINTIYIVGHSDTFATPFFADLSEALESEDEVGFYTLGEHWIKRKRIVRVFDPDEALPTEPREHYALVFSTRLMFYRYYHFSREDFAAFVHGGNTDNGPLRASLCTSSTGKLCLRKTLRDAHCSTCFNEGIPRFPKLLEPVFTFFDSFIDEIDEGCCAEPLGLPKTLYTYHS